MIDKTVEIFEGDRAKNYEDFVDAWIPNYRSFMQMIPMILPSTEEEKILVVGCGTGNEIMAINQCLYDWQITGVDPSEEMLCQAKEKLKEFSNVKLINGTVDQLSLEVNFSAATLLLVLHFMPDDGTKLNLLKDIHIRLQPNAPFVLLDITGEGNEFDQNLDVLLQLIPDTVIEEQKAWRKDRFQNELYKISETRLSELLMEAGFDTPTRFFQSTIYQGWITKKQNGK